MWEFDDVNFHLLMWKSFPNMISVSAILYIIALYGIDSHIIQSNLYSRAHFNRTLESSTVFYVLLLILWHECKLIITYLHRYLLKQSLIFMLTRRFFCLLPIFLVCLSLCVALLLVFTLHFPILMRFPVLEMHKSK